MAKNDYRLITGDANEVIPNLVKEGVKVDMVFCSPNPLFFSLKRGAEIEKQSAANVGSEHTLQDYLTHLYNIFMKIRLVLKHTGSLFVHMMDTYLMQGSMVQIPERFAIMMAAVNDAGSRLWLLRGKYVWLRGSHEITEGSNISPWDWEPIYHFTKQETGYTWNADAHLANTSVVHGPWERPRNDGGSGFPHLVIMELMSLTTKPGDTVMDCFMGTGETGVAALRVGRKFIGIDLFAEKVALSQRRLRNLSP
jgi:DNA methylase